MGEDVISTLGDSGANVLRVGSETQDGTAVCTEFGQRGHGESSADIVVTVERSADDWLADHQRHGLVTEDTVVLSVGEEVRSSVATNGLTASPPQPIGGPVIDGVPNTSDLAALGVKLSEYLQTIDADASGPQQDCQLCVDSLSGLLDANDTEPVFRFLHLLTRQVDSVGATAHYHLDPAKHDQQTIDTLDPLFDTRTEG